MNLKEIQILQEAYMSVYEETDAERDKRLADRRARVAELQVSGRTMTPARRAREKAQQRKSEQEQEKLDKILGSIRGGSSKRSDKPMGSTPPAEKERAPEANRRLKSKIKSDTLASKADEVLRSLKKEDLNVFDILISHLLHEGYADDVKNAYCILENMSEDWVVEILEGKMELPVSKMSRQARRKAFRAGKELNKPIVDKYEKAMQDVSQLTKMSRVGGPDVVSHIDKGFQQGKKSARSAR